ncbi:MAG: methyl-accepting chemotaxis protein [Pseudobutyrivibrio sp.]|nr:methyl-accepting chemotaxis protein [Pseudobutyrivibrio sp.]
MKTKKLSTKITVFVVIATIIGVAILSMLAAYKIFSVMKTEAVNQLAGTVNSNVEQLNRFMEKEYAYIDGYMATDQFQNMLVAEQDPEVISAAQTWTEKFSHVVPNLLSVFYANDDGLVLVDSISSLVGYQNDPDTVAFLKELYNSSGGVPMYGLITVVSPATNDITIIATCSSYVNGEFVGYSSVELDKTEFYELLQSIQIGENQEVVLTSVSSNQVFYSTNPEEITLASENPAIVEIVTKLTNGEYGDATEGTINYVQAGTGKSMLGYFKYLPQQDWLLFVGAEEDELYASASDASNLIMLMAVIVIIAIAVILSIIINILIKPIGKVEKAISRVADHDITANKDLTSLSKRKDEIGKLARCTQEVIDTLNEAVGLFKDCSGSLSESSRDLNNASSLLGEVTSENRDIADNLSVKINETNDSIESIHEEINNIVNLVTMVTEKVEAGENDSQKLIDSATEMNEKIDTEIENNTATLQETMVNMQEALESLKAVEQINALAEDIMSITSQTNLLSLNASIEAARAGEAGKGFAVVAGEIGQLADQSKETAMNITEIVAASNKSVSSVRDQVTKLIEYIKSDVMSSFQVFADQSKHYDEGILEIKKAVTDIGEAMESLSDSINEIARGITSVNDASVENTEGVTNILGKNTQASDVSVNIERLAESSRANAESLKGAINQFKID